MSEIALRYGVWLLDLPAPLEDRRYWAENEGGSGCATSFSRALGIASHLDGSLCFSGGIGQFSRAAGPPVSLAALLKDHFGTQLRGIVPRLPAAALAQRLRRAGGYAVLAGPGLRMRSVPGLAGFVATAWVRTSTDERPGCEETRWRCLR